MKDNSFDSEEFSLDDSEVNEETEDMNEEKNINNLDLIKVISDILTTIIEENEKLPNIKQIVLNQKKMCFNEIAIPNVLIYDYLKRIQEYSFIERNTLILSLIYIDRLCTLGQITLTYQMFVSDEIFNHYNSYLISSSEIKKNNSSVKKEEF